MSNLHCHAFQRAMAGLAELRGPRGDDFWSWRTAMYTVAARMTPELLDAVAAGLYLEFLKRGYTAVGEFHYLHRQANGVDYDDPAQLSRIVVAAARRVGIAITHLPALYAHGGFGAAPLLPGQRRFASSAAGVLGIVDTIRRAHRGDPCVAVGVAPHSLRAVMSGELRDLVTGLRALASDAPIHIHCAEQIKEVDDCLAWSGRRPVDWLLDNAPVDSRWCIVHATQMTDDETRRLAASGAVAGQCPTTEGNLGDGFFNFQTFTAANGSFGVGSDSNVSTSPFEEMRMLEYVQRLIHRRRVVATSAAQPSTGVALWTQAARNGARALAQPAGALSPGLRADLVVLDSAHAALIGRRGAAVVDAAIFASTDSPVRDVMVGGAWIVRDRRHARDDEIGAAFAAALTTLADAL
jgi:formimidoylglutamate deiminase